MAVTRADVAKLAGTSPALVSYVLNGGPRSVAPQTRQRILEAIDTLGYRPNLAARSLRMARGHILGLLLPDSSNPFFAELASIVEISAYDRGYPVMVGNTADDPEREISYMRAFVDRQVEGLIAITSSGSEALAAEWAAVTVPVVALDRIIDPSRIAHVLVDGEQGALEGTRHLIEHGHHRIACVSGPDLPTTAERVRGYRTAIEEAGLAPGPVVGATFGGAAGYGALEQLMGRDPRPTAVLVTSDLQALGLLRAAYDAGLRVPEDLAVVAFDGIAYGAYTRPGLTTYAQPVQDLGTRATELLIEQIRSGERQSGIERVLGGLVTRASCGCSESETSAP